MRFAAGLVTCCLLSACSDYDKDYVPYKVKGFATWVSAGDQTWYAGTAQASYSDRQSGLSMCQQYAVDLARSKNLQKWGYVCCTVTDDSSCVTKVR